MSEEDGTTSKDEAEGKNSNVPIGLLPVSILNPASPLWLTIIECLPWFYHEIRYHVSHPDRHTVPTRIRFLLRILHGMEPFLDLILLWVQFHPQGQKEQQHYHKIQCYKEWLQFTLQNTLLYHQIYSWRGQQDVSNNQKMFFLPLLPHHQHSVYRVLPLTEDLPGNHLNSHRNTYIGPRTGKRIGGQLGTVSLIARRKVTWKGVTFILLSEILHFLRFPIWTSFNFYQQERKKENKPKTELYVWLFTLLMDMTSIQLLQQGLNVQLLCKTNTLLSRAKYFHDRKQLYFAYQLLFRRKLRLWLYIIKSPLWESITRPLVRKVCHLICKLLPLIGPWAEQYLLSWIDYYQTHHAYLLEQEH